MTMFGGGPEPINLTSFPEGQEFSEAFADYATKQVAGTNYSGLLDQLPAWTYEVLLSPTISPLGIPLASLPCHPYSFVFSQRGKKYSPSGAYNSALLDELPGWT